MIRPLYAILGALLLLLGWLFFVGYQVNWQPAIAICSLADSAERCRLVGLAARGYLLAADLKRHELRTHEQHHTNGNKRELIAEIVHLRTTAARVLLDNGYREAAEMVALKAAQANYADMQARALLLETRLGGASDVATRRELMLLVLQAEHPQVLYVLGKALAMNGQVQDATGYLERAVTLDPNHFPAQFNLAQIILADSKRITGMERLNQAALVARRGKEHEQVVRLRASYDPNYQIWLPLLSIWWQQHGLLLGLITIYLVFLVSPLWLTPLRNFTTRVLHI